MDQPRPTAELAALALIYHQRVSGAHNNDDRDVPCQWCVLRAEQHVEADALRAAARPADGEGLDGAARIVRERRRQIEELDYQPYHDDAHDTGALARAAAVYAIPDGLDGMPRTRAFDLLWPISWPFKPSPKDRIRELEKAGALIAAEIDRLLRVALTANPSRETDDD